MSSIPPFHSINESRKGAPRYHTNDACAEARAIPRDDVRGGSGGYFLCERCGAMRPRREPGHAAPAPES